MNIKVNAKLYLSYTILSASILTASAQSNEVEQNVSLSPFARSILYNSSINTSPLFKMDGFQVWSIQLPNQQPETVLTSPSGLLIKGTIFSPNGKNLSTAFSDISSVDAFNTVQNPTVIDAIPLQPAMKIPEGVKPAAINSPALTPPPALIPQNAQEQKFDARAASGMDDADIPTFSTLAEFRDQADNFSMWVQANKFNEGAPVLYMFADPRCPYCARSFVELKPFLDRGEIELRIIPVPVLSSKSFELALRFVHSETAGQDFVAHGQAILNGEKEPEPLPVTEIDQRVVKAMTKNVKWFRKNAMQSVPFYLYKTAEGDQVLAGQISQENIKNIITTGQTDGKGINNVK